MVTADQMTCVMRYFNRQDLCWRVGRDRLVLCLRESGAELFCVVPDASHPRMWRIIGCDGRSSDVANLARAKEAAVSLALAALNRAPEAGQRALEPRPCGFGPGMA